MRAIQKAQEKANETFHNHALRSFDERLQDAVSAWFENNGHIKAEYIANLYKVPVHYLTIQAQKRIAEIAGIPIKDSAPKVEILAPESYYKQHYPRSSYAHADGTITFETFYFIKNQL